MSRVLVTGGTGFTGSHLARRLVDEGSEVVGLVRPGSESRLPAGARAVSADLGNRESVLAAVTSAGPVDTVYHIAATFRTQHADLGEFRRVNVEGTRHLLDAAEHVGVDRFVHCSTVGVQGQIDDPPADESYRTAPGDVYQRTKLEGEELALERGRTGLPVSVIRPVGIYGPGDLRFLKLFKPIARRRMVMIGSGRTLYHLTHVDDVVQGAILAARSPRAVGEVFTIGGPRYTTLDELVHLIAAALKVPPPRLRLPYAPVYAAAVVCDRVCRTLNVAPPLYPRRVEFFAKDRAFTIGKARQLLGFEPRVGLQEGLEATAAWYRAQGLL